MGHLLTLLDEMGLDEMGWHPSQIRLTGQYMYVCTVYTRWNWSVQKVWEWGEKREKENRRYYSGYIKLRVANS